MYPDVVDHPVDVHAVLVVGHEITSEKHLQKIEKKEDTMVTEKMFKHEM